MDLLKTGFSETNLSCKMVGLWYPAPLRFESCSRTSMMARAVSETTEMPGAQWFVPTHMNIASVPTMTLDKTLLSSKSPSMMSNWRLTRSRRVGNCDISFAFDRTSSLRVSPVTFCWIKPCKTADPVAPVAPSKAYVAVVCPSKVSYVQCCVEIFQREKKIGNSCTLGFATLDAWQTLKKPIASVVQGHSFSYHPSLLLDCRIPRRIGDHKFHAIARICNSFLPRSHSAFPLSLSAFPHGFAEMVRDRRYSTKAIQ